MKGSMSDGLKAFVSAVVGAAAGAAIFGGFAAIGFAGDTDLLAITLVAFLVIGAGIGLARYGLHVPRKTTALPKEPVRPRGPPG